jgi:hypothetical protein
MEDKTRTYPATKININVRIIGRKIIEMDNSYPMRRIPEKTIAYPISIIIKEEITSDRIRILLGKYIFFTIIALFVIDPGPLFKFPNIKVKANRPDDKKTQNCGM